MRSLALSLSLLLLPLQPLSLPLPLLLLSSCLVWESGLASSEPLVDSRSHVTVLTEVIFDNFVTSTPMSLVQFYAPWCGYCQKLAPEYERAARILAGEADLAKIDCTLNKRVCEKYQIKGFPTMLFMRSDGFFEPYEGERETGAIVRYMRKQSRPPFVVLTTQVEIAEFRARDFVAIAWLADANNSPEFLIFQSVANSLRNDCEFGLVTNPELFVETTTTTTSSHKGESTTTTTNEEGRHTADTAIPTTTATTTHTTTTTIAVPALTVYKSFDDHEVPFLGEWSEKSMRDFIVFESFPLVGGIGASNYSKYISRGLPILWLFVDPQNETSSTHIIAEAESVAKEFRGKISTVALDGVRWHQHARALGLQGVPGAVVQVEKRNENFVLMEPFSATSLHAHISGVLQGTISSSLKSQDIPKGKEGNVTVLVGQNFEQVTQDVTKSVFVLFFAPWCGHCKNVLPKWGELADLFADSSDVIIAKLDVTANDVRIPLQGVPTFMLFSGGTSVVYDGDRETDALHRFLSESVPHAVRSKQEL